MNREQLLTSFSKPFSSFIQNRILLAWSGAFVISLVVILLNVNTRRSISGNNEEFLAGKVADRDVIAEETIRYEDSEATRLRIEAQEQLVAAVFNYSYQITEDLKTRWNHFATLAGSLPMEEHSRDAFRLGLQSEFPGDFSDEILDLLYRNPERPIILRDCTMVLGAVLERGIFSVPQAGLERLNPDMVELIRQSGARIEKERVPFGSVVTRDKSSEAAAVLAAAGSYHPLLIQLAPQLLKPFLRENVFYSPEDTALRLAETRAAVEPVMRSIEQGKPIIRKGFIISEEDMAELRAFRTTLPNNDLSVIFADLLFLFLLFGLLYFFCGSRVVGRNLRESETYLIAGLSAFYIAGSVLVKNISLEFMPVSVVVPTALVIILPSILIHPRLALIMAMLLPLGAFVTGSFDAASYIFALGSGIVAAYSIQRARKRMDLVKAGLYSAAGNLSIMVALLLWQRSSAGLYPPALFWACFNGIASGMLVLGVLPPLEQALNTATAFRLIELSDLNAPILRRLFAAAPGTYSHSIMVANLAEAACQDIGANPLVARVGAYYHDLGKIENPEYFVENQTDHNRHDDIAPRLSATVIRSHVKLGLEKARQLGLPREVIEIIGEHHGNSVITWFYNKALKQEGGDPKKAPVNMEDFSYPGEPPHSRESAVVMLADVAEAAVRTLDKPTVPKVEKFVQELIEQKVEHGQLAQSELTFRDLETIKNAFVRVLASHYHSRIEYPKLGEGDGNSAPAETRPETPPQAAGEAVNK